MSEEQPSYEATPAGPPKIYYILDTRSMVGNCALWWGPDSAGYVCNLDEAGKYSEDDKRGKRDTDVFVPCEVAERHVVRHVRVDVEPISAYMMKGREAIHAAADARAKKGRRR